MIILNLMANILLNVQMCIRDSIGIGVSETTLYFGTSIYSSPGGLIDEILYYSRGFDTVLESSILMMAFVVASWVALHFTMKRREEE